MYTKCRNCGLGSSYIVCQCGFNKETNEMNKSKATFWYLLVIGLLALMFSVLVGCTKYDVKPTRNYDTNKVSVEYVSTHEFKLTARMAYNNNQSRYWELESNGNLILLTNVAPEIFWKYQIGEVIPSYILVQYYEQDNR